MRRSASQFHAAVLTLVYFMSAFLMCRHVVSQMCVCVESLLTGMTSFVSDVQVDRVLVLRHGTPRLCAV